MTKYIEKPYQFTSYSLPSTLPLSPFLSLAFPCPAFPSIFLSLPEPSTLLFQYELIPSRPTTQLFKDFFSPLSYKRSFFLDLGVFLSVFLFFLLLCFIGAHVLEVSQECAHEGKFLVLYLLGKRCIYQSSAKM